MSTVKRSREKENQVGWGSEIGVFLKLLRIHGGQQGPEGTENKELALFSMKSFPTCLLIRHRFLPALLRMETVNLRESTL